MEAIPESRCAGCVATRRIMCLSCTGTLETSECWPLLKVLHKAPVRNQTAAIEAALFCTPKTNNLHRQFVKAHTYHLKGANESLPYLTAPPLLRAITWGHATRACQAALLEMRQLDLCCFAMRPSCHNGLRRKWHPHSHQGTRYSHNQPHHGTKPPPTSR